MTKARILLFLGLWVSALPHLGFPYYIKNILFLATGLFLIYISILIYNQNKNYKKQKNFSDSFIENNSFEIDSNDKNEEQIENETKNQKQKVEDMVNKERSFYYTPKEHTEIIQEENGQVFTEQKVEEVFYQNNLIKEETTETIEIKTDSDTTKQPLEEIKPKKIIRRVRRTKLKI